MCCTRRETETQTKTGTETDRETYAVRVHVFEHARVRALHAREIGARRLDRALHSGAARGGQRTLALRVRLLGVEQCEVAQQLRAVALELETVRGETPL
jgi:hypothetical protein